MTLFEEKLYEEAVEDNIQDFFPIAKMKDGIAFAKTRHEQLKGNPANTLNDCVIQGINLSVGATVYENAQAFNSIVAREGCRAPNQATSFYDNANGFSIPAGPFMLAIVNGKAAAPELVVVKEWNVDELDRLAADHS